MIKKRISCEEQQMRILDFVNNTVKIKGYPPSVREICSALDIKSTSTVHNYLSRLEKEGLIIKDPTKPRAIKVLNKNANDAINESFVEVPLIGKVTAGEPIFAVENITDTFMLPESFCPGSELFMLRVEGQSMIEAGIFNGDYVLVKKQSSAENGDIVVALLGDEATVKTFYREKDYIRLQPQNKTMKPIIVRQDIIILGKVTGVFRFF